MNTTVTGVAAGADAVSPTDQDTTVSVRLADLFSLYTRPRQFFSRERDLGSMKFLLPIIWLIGITAQIDRMDTEILRYQMGQARMTWDLIGPIVTQSWLMFWFFCVGVGILSGTILYFVAGFWFGLRVRWAGAKGASWMHARHVYAWQSAIVALPIVLITASYSFIYPNYLVAYNSETLIAYAYMALIFWSVGVSYVGVNTRFELTKWKARLWFLALPIVFYVLALGLIVGLVSYLS